MRTMQHNSRANSAGATHGSKHNDRNFDSSKADNINPDLSYLNIYENVYNDPNMTFSDVELRFYQENFGEQLERTNERYRKNGHPERCKDMTDWMRAKRNAPEETVMQIGSIEASVSREQLWECYQDYQQRLDRWNLDHGCPMTILDTALHCDEAVPHVQSRRVWHYRTPDGELRLGQEKALEAAGVPLPDPSKAPGRHNNRKQTFDMITRSMWLDVIQEHHIDVEREPVPGARHNLEKVDMLREKSLALQAQTSDLMDRIAQAERDLQTSTLRDPVPEGKRVLGGVKFSAADAELLRNQAQMATAANRAKERSQEEVTRLQERVTCLKQRPSQLELEISKAHYQTTIQQLERQLERQTAQLHALLRWAVQRLVELWERLVEPLHRREPSIWTFEQASQAADEPLRRQIQAAQPEIRDLESSLGGSSKALDLVLQAKGIPEQERPVIRQKSHGWER